MREIKFRGKCIANGKWVYGSLLRWPDGCCTILESKDGCNYVWKRDIDPDTVGQFTGLNDRNGKEVYENDILRVYDRKTYFNIIVSWSKEAVAFMVCYCDKNQSPLSWFSNLLPNGYEIEVLGNIHDNPELLEDEG